MSSIGCRHGITTSSIYRGSSIYSRRPVICFTLGQSLAETPPRTFDRAFVESLLARLPGLRERADPCDAPGVLERGIIEGDRVSQRCLFEHLCIELQNMTGANLRCVRANESGGGWDQAVVPYEDERVAMEAGRLALDLIDPPSSADRRPAESMTPSFDFQRRLESFLQFAERQVLPVQDRAVVRAAEARDIPVFRLAGRLVQLGHGRFQQRLSATQTTRTNVVANQLAANKDYSRRVLRAVGLPVPSYERVYRQRDAVAAAKRIGFPIVVKPNNGNMGLGVSIGVKTAGETRAAYKRARKFGRSVIVEQFIAGADYRMLVIDGKLQAAAKRVPAHVVGDGVRTIEELVRQANDDPRRGAGQRSSWTRIEFDEQADRLLLELGYKRNSVARDGEVVYLRRNANTSAGGTAVDVTDHVHPENREIAVRAATSIGLDVAGVDLLVHDIALPMRAQGGVICEVNSRPGVRKHLWPAEGRPRDVIGPIVDMLFPPGAPARIPIAVVTGNGNTAPAAQLLAHILSSEGATVGLADRNGVFVSGQRVDGGGIDGPTATRMLLLNPAVEVAVLELSPTEILQHGLGFDWCDVCAVVYEERVNISDLGDALRLVVGAARSAVLLSTSEESLHALELHTGAQLWCVGANGRPAERSVALENAAGVMSICFWKSERLAARIPIPSNTSPAGATEAPDLQSVLYAAALALSLGKPPHNIERALHNFSAERGS